MVFLAPMSVSLSMSLRLCAIKRLIESMIGLINEGYLCQFWHDFGEILVFTEITLLLFADSEMMDGQNSDSTNKTNFGRQ